MGRYEALLERAGCPSASCPALLRYLELLEAWGDRVNLTGARTPEGRVATLIEPTLVLLPLLLPRKPS